jgi:hypothetical protein
MMVGPSFWIVGTLIGIAIGALAGLIACLLVWPESGRELRNEARSATIADEKFSDRFLRYLLGLLLVFYGAMICMYFVADEISKALR